MSQRESNWFALTSFATGSGLAILLFALGLLAIGFVATSRNEPSSAGNENVAADSNISTVRLSDEETDTTESVETNLSEVLSVSSDFDRSVALDRMLSTPSVTQLLDLINQTIEIANPIHRKNVLTEIFQRFALIDPSHALFRTKEFPRSLRNHLASVVFHEWSLIRLNEVIEYAKKLDHDEKSVVFSTIHKSRTDLPVSEKQELAGHLGLEQHLAELIEQDNQSEIQEDPNRAWTELIDTVNSRPVIDDDQAYALTKIALSIIEEEGLSTIDRLSSSITHRWTRNAVVSGVLYRIAITDPKSAFDQATTMLDHSNRHLIFTIIDRWKYQDRAAALNAVAKLPRNELRNNLQRVLLLDWAWSEPVATLEAVSKLPQSAFRDQLTNEVLVLWARANPQEALEQISSLPESIQPDAKLRAIRALIANDPKVAVQYIEDFPAGRERRNVVVNALRQWAQIDTVEAIEWTLSDPRAESYRRELMSMLPINVTDENVDLLMKLALDHPLDGSGEGFERHIVARLAFIDVEKAKALLPRVREGRTRLMAHVAIGFSCIFARNDPGEAIAYSDQVADNQKSEYLGLVLGGWAMRQPQQAYDYVEQLPSTESKARAAMWLIAYNTHNRNVTYSEDQIEHLSSYLTEKELKELEDDNLWQETMGY